MGPAGGSGLGANRQLCGSDATRIVIWRIAFDLEQVATASTFTGSSWHYACLHSLSPVWSP
jgi:hypothetical protein